MEIYFSLHGALTRKQEFIYYQIYIQRFLHQQNSVYWTPYDRRYYLSIKPDTKKKREILKNMDVC